MSELKTLLAEAKSSLQDLESLLQRARSLDDVVHGNWTFGREEMQSCVNEISRVIEKIPENLQLQKRLQREGEIEQLHREMEQVRHRVEASIGRMEAACERNVTQLAEFTETLQQRFEKLSQESQVTPPMSQLNELLSQGKSSLASKDYETCMALMNEALHVAPTNSEAASCLEEAQRKLEDQRLEEELVVHIDNLKKEAMDLFDQEKYKECATLFKFLCELEPKNRTLQDYLELSQEKVQEMKDAEMAARPEQETENITETALPASSLQEDVSAKGSLTPLSAAISRTVASETPGSALTIEAQARFSEVPEDAEVSRWGHSLGVVFGVLAVLAAVLAGALFLRGFKTAGSVDLRTEPSGASVSIDGQPRGQAPLRVDSLKAGQHTLSVAKEGYAPASKAFVVSAGQPSSLSVQLQPLSPAPLAAQPLQQEAAELFDRGMWLEASQRCDALLAEDPHSLFAARLKDTIRNQYWQQSQSAQRRGRAGDARIALQNLLRVSPQDGAAINALKSLKAKAGKDSPLNVPEELPLQGRIEELRRQIAAAMNAANYFPPASGNAWELIQRLGSMAPADPAFKERMDQIHREAVSQLQRKIQGKDADGARALGRHLQEYFPASAELRSLRESLKAGEAGQLEARNSLMQKLDSAMAHGNYVTPANDSALAYCNRLLALDRQNPKAQALKREIATRASAQAKDLLSNEKFDQARDVLSALLAAAQSEGRPAAAQEAKAQLDKLEFTAYPVIHDHALGSCSGRLRMNAYVIAYVPSGDSKDGFSQKLTEVVETEPGDKLKIQLKNKTYRFQPNLIKNKEGSRQKVQEIQARLATLMANGK
ncbi:MAG: PEGA domain-containing protein [Acidobacteria bacterium]|nr:PEGA domain-containing protein [Acidobacteriota bacterium]